jgi:hypothetical protein
MILDTLKKSPITRTELFYQQRSQAPNRRWRRPLFYSLMTLLSLFSVIVGVITLSGGFVEEAPARVVLTVFYVLMIILHFNWMLRTLTLASAAVTREKRDAERWEALLLTGVTGREIVLGKWWATIKTMWRSYVFLAFVRATTIISLSNFGDNIVPLYSSYYRYNVPNTSIPNLLLGIVFVMALTLINLPYTAACGVMAAMDTKRGGGGLPRAFAARAAFTILAAIVPMLLWTFFGFWAFRNLANWDYSQTSEISNFLSQHMRIMLDNSLGFSSDIVVNNYWIESHLFAVVFLLAQTMATYAAMTWALLRFAQWRAERTGALKSSEHFAAKKQQS